ncbi:putative uncharacterized protein [Mycolicibacterium canariasense]|uniref:Uncharacterized protein n=1 Tax=Mycolicibacterium canariasense TaxID=228230 RepID=A0A100WIH4_MYCCR|nr:hypothetical protein [Mycolicibacterium canariasense]MCV7210154.1 hypothetical protein [Mycolicibacterium canariasense]ORU97860.1 hypothetical protein AWB94_29340 [Mycolicibacterium canariasense]GAS98801.1 putative uncharacterized protein [Mycolicibacterium canariasense]
MPIPCTDPALHVVQVVTQVLREVFDPDSDCPPEGGGTKDVRFLANGIPGIPPGLVTDCREGPLVWVQLISRYRAKRSQFPAVSVSDGPCRPVDVIPVVALEIGVARCASMEARYIDWDAIASEELISLDDSWRIETALTVAVCRLKSKDRAVATDTVAPIGPEGEARAWTAPIFVQLVQE